MLAAALLLGGASRGIAEGPSIEVRDRVQVSGDRANLPHFEPHLAAHPTDPAVLLGATVTLPEIDPPGGLNATIVSGFRSEDGGRSWSRFDLPSCNSDPWVTFDGDRAHIACLASDPASIVVYTSQDGGVTWNGGTSVPRGAGGSTDRPILVAASRGGTGSGTVYAVFGQHFLAEGLSQTLFGPSVSRSEDAGRSFDTPFFLRHDNLQQQPFAALALSDGSLAILFMDFAGPEGLLQHRRTWLARSEDRGRSFSTPSLVLDQRDHEMPWSAAVDTSSEHRDRIYVVADGFWQRRGARPGDLPPDGAELFVISSDDRGRSWSRRRPVTDPSVRSNQETPAIAVNPDGVVGVAWYDTRHDPRGECFDLYFTASLDGGESFLPSIRVTPETSCPRAVLEQRGLAARWPFGGDYSGLAAGADGEFHLFWADSRRGVYQVWSAAARVLTTALPWDSNVQRTDELTDLPFEAETRGGVTPLE